MIRNNGIKGQFDTEKAYDSIINSTEFNSVTRNKISSTSSTGIMAQQLNQENFDTFLEKRNRKPN